jgi:hypothetical protein
MRHAAIRARDDGRMDQVLRPVSQVTKGKTTVPVGTTVTNPGRALRPPRP